MPNEKEVSRRLSRIVDCMGYNQRMSNYRRAAYMEEQSMSLVPSVEGMKIVGSRGEGISRYLESDLDILLIPNYIMCIEESLLHSRLAEIPYTFTMGAGSRPGHCTLRLMKRDHFRTPDLECAMCFMSGDYFLSSSRYKESRYRNNFGRTELGYAHVVGPAISNSSPHGGDTDFVPTFLCFCPSILERWMVRPRRHDWPPPEVRQRIVQMEGNVVATGCKGSQLEDFEWRLCFNEIELLLVTNLNDTQMKLYRMLKMIKDDLLKPRHNEISSYIVKNIVFWLAESYSESMFTRDNLFHWVVKALRLLKRSVKMYFLPNYLIPERNLLEEKLQPSDRWRVFYDLGDIIDMGPNVLLNLKKMNPFTGLSPVELLQFREKRDELEMMFILSKRLRQQDFQSGREDNMSVTTSVLCRVIELYLSYWPDKVQEEMLSCSARPELLHFFIG